MSRDAEEGFCELVAYLLMDSQHEEAQKEFILRNHYTRGQISLFIAAEQRFGFDQMLDWMRYGESSELEAGHLEKIRDIKLPAPPGPVANGSALNAGTNVVARSPAPIAVPKPASIRLQGILWGNHPTAIINDHTVSANDRFTLQIGATQVNLRCLEIIAGLRPRPKPGYRPAGGTPFIGRAGSPLPAANVVGRTTGRASPEGAHGPRHPMSGGVTRPTG